MQPKIMVITGPTASGKSRLALNLAGRTPVEIISADSAQVYQGMDIGTAKPDAEVQSQVPHHLISIRDPSDPYSAALFREDVESMVPGIIARGNLPLVVGGTMLYLKALKEGLADLPEANPSIRQEISEFANSHGWDAVHGELERVDPDTAARIRPSDTQRLQRALEVYRITGLPMTVLHERVVPPCPYPITEIAIVPRSREALHQVIAGRFKAMLAAGFVDEVKALYERGDLDPGLPSIKAVGYRQAWGFLEGEIDYETMVETAITATRQLAKRQFTWLRSWKGLHVLDSPDIEQVLKIGRSATILG